MISLVELGVQTVAVLLVETLLWCVLPLAVLSRVCSEGRDKGRCVIYFFSSDFPSQAFRNDHVQIKNDITS